VNSRATTAVPTSLATTITTAPATTWPCPISHSAPSFTGSNITVGSANSASAA
jgi:hypothetical protein